MRNSRSRDGGAPIASAHRRRSDQSHVTQELARSPATVREIYRLLLEGKQSVDAPQRDGIDFNPFGFAACRPALAMIIEYCVAQNLIRRGFTVEELFDGTTRAL